MRFRLTGSILFYSTVFYFISFHLIRHFLVYCISPSFSLSLSHSLQLHTLWLPISFATKSPILGHRTVTVTVTVNMLDPHETNPHKFHSEFHLKIEANFLCICCSCAIFLCHLHNLHSNSASFALCNSVSLSSLCPLSLLSLVPLLTP